MYHDGKSKKKKLTAASGKKAMDSRWRRGDNKEVLDGLCCSSETQKHHFCQDISVHVYLHATFS